MKITAADRAKWLALPDAEIACYESIQTRGHFYWQARRSNPFGGRYAWDGKTRDSAINNAIRAERKAKKARKK